MRTRKPNHRKPDRNRALPCEPKKVEPDYVIDVDVYHASVLVFYTKAKMNGWMRDRGIPEDHVPANAENACVIGDRDRTGVFWILMFLPKVVKIHTLAHECVHAAHLLLHQCGVTVTWDNDEPLAYLVDCLVRAIDRNSDRLRRGGGR